jgi:hypothetical protein
LQPIAAKIAVNATAIAVQDRFMKTPSRVTARFGLAGGLKATARGFREEPRFATVLSGCDAEFALRVDPFCPSLSTSGTPQHVKEAPRNLTSLPL